MKLSKKTYLTGSGPVCFSQGILAEQPSQANGNTMTLKDVRIVEEGEAKGHGTWRDSEFVAKTVELAQNRRIKCRFGHPEMCKESFGTYLGYYDNFRVMQDENGTYAIADLHLAEAANLSPNGKMADYIMQLSKDAPDLFGNSIVFCYQNEYFRTDKGIKVLSSYLFDDPNEESYILEDGTPYDQKRDGVIDTSKVYVDIVSLGASDLVDEPAATSGLFAKGDLLTRVATFFGLDFGGMRKTAALKKLIQEFNNMAREKLSIGATIADGSKIIVETGNSFIGVGDMVNDSNGVPVADGSCDITDSDSGQSGITITTSGGIITRIEPTVQEVAQSSDAANDALSTAVRNITSDVEKLKKGAKDFITQAQYQQMLDRVQALESQSAGERTILNKKESTNRSLNQKGDDKHGWLSGD
jgi:hypothetical protein